MLAYIRLNEYACYAFISSQISKSQVGASIAKWLRLPALKLLAPLRSGSNPTRGSRQLLKESCWFTPRNNLLLHMSKITTIYTGNQIRLKNGVKHQFTSISSLFYLASVED